MSRKKLLMFRNLITAAVVFCSLLLSNHAQTECHVKTYVDGIQSQMNEHLVYVIDGTIQTSEMILLSNLDNVYSPSISQDGSTIAWVDNEISQSETVGNLYIYDITANELTTLDIFDSVWVEPDIIQWISIEEIIVIYKTSKIKIPEWYPGFIINVDTNEIAYIYPTRYVDNLFEEIGVSSTPLIEVWEYQAVFPPQFTSDGRYLIVNDQGISNHYLVIDTESRDIVQEVENSIWSYDGEFVARFGNDSDSNLMTIYNVSDNIIRDQIRITDIKDYFLIWRGISWSPNGNYIAYPELENTPRYLNFINLREKKITTTCFTEFLEYSHGDFQFLWSSDGRYLAFYGVPETLENPETGTIYIYDTETDIAYEVFTGDAEIIGWARLPEENR